MGNLLQGQDGLERLEWNGFSPLNRHCGVVSSSIACAGRTTLRLPGSSPERGITVPCRCARMRSAERSFRFARDERYPEGGSKSARSKTSIGEPTR
jgi:hypothetical protein